MSDVDDRAPEAAILQRRLMPSGWWADATLSTFKAILTGRLPRFRRDQLCRRRGQTFGRQQRKPPASQAKGAKLRIHHQT